MAAKLRLVATVALAMILALQAKIMIDSYRYHYQSMMLAVEHVLLDESKPTHNNSNRTATTATIEKLPASIPSMASCLDLPESTRRFFPKRFFEEGKGRRFLQPFYDYVKVYRRVFLVFKDIHKNNNNNNNNNTSTASSCEAVYLHHNHKVAGTTMGLAGFRNPDKFQFEPYYADRQDTMGRIDNKFDNFSVALMKSIYENQQQLQEKETILFSFTRDPVERFVSSVGKVLQTEAEDLSPCPERTSNNVGNISDSSAISSATARLLQCVLDKIEQDASYLNEHLVPQAFQFYKSVLDFDIGIDIMDIQHLPSVLQAMGVSKVPSRSAVALVDVGYYNLTSTAALTPDMIRAICRLYAMDVAMMRATGVMTSTSVCKNNNNALLSQQQ